jgi:Polyketide cyclase / dehydrase and lipid transport
MNYYEFVTIWRFDAPAEKVWAEISNSGKWSDWWKGVLSVEELKAGDADGIGAIHRSKWRSALPYTLEFDSEVVRVEPFKTIEARAFGELEGIGLWTLTAENETSTHVRYDWKVKTTKAWMIYLAPIAKPFFRWNHDVIMNWGGEGLAKKLNCKLLSEKH